MRFATQPKSNQVALSRDLVQAVRFTRHAQNQMTFRGILKPTVLAVIENGRTVPNHNNELIQFMGFCVVMEESKVITAFYRDHWGQGNF